ncbi:MAG: choice-of-anchor R domain-containing protein [Limisphaerales bacterium]
MKWAHPTTGLAIALLSGLILSTGSSSASVILSNLDGNDGTGTLLGGSTRSKAMGFQIGSSAVTLDSVTLRLEIVDFTSVDIDVALFDDTGATQPGSSLMTFSNPTISANGIANFTFDAPSNPTLDAGETYWIVVRDHSTATTTRWMANSPSVTPTDPTPSTIDALHVGTKFSTLAYPPTGSSAILTSYALTAIPEPAQLVAAGALVLGTFAAGRRLAGARKS